MIFASKKPVWATLTAVLLFHAAVISLQTSSRVNTGFMRIWLLDSLAPAEKVVDTATEKVSGFWYRYFALIGVQRENEALRAEVDKLRLQLHRDREDILEAQRLRDMLALRENIAGRNVVARVIGRDASQFQTVTIDKGRSHGVQPDSAVISPQGVVGRVIFAGNFYSIVQLILDSQSAVGVLVGASRRQGIVRGLGTNELDLDYIDDDNDIKEGDELITSGMDRIYPRGIPVGAITSVGPRVGLFKTVRIRPGTDLGRLEEVLCIVDPPDEVNVINPTESHPH